MKFSKPAPWHFSPARDGKTAVSAAVVMVRNVRAGPPQPLNRAGFAVQFGNVTCQRISGYGLSDIGFEPAGELAYFGTADSYPCQVVLTRSDSPKPVFAGRLSPYRDASLKPGERPDPLQFRPSTTQSPPLEPGLHVITCARHPWQRGYLWVVDNPYVAESGSRGDNTGIFQIEGIPAGRHTVELWHPLLEPVSRTHEVEIQPDQVAELPAEFRLPG